MTRALLLLLVLAGCGAAAGTPTQAPTPPARPAVDPAPPAPVGSFSDWRAAFRGRALAAGIRAQVFDAAFAGVAPNPEVERLDGVQPEFTKPIWEYLDGAVSDSRVTAGQAKAAAVAALPRIEARYGVDSGVIVAIWGIESGFGGNFGSIPVIQALATLAYEGRRRAWGEEQLIAALQILQSGDITPARMVGSWAGAMGHTQFVPTSYLSHAVDFTGDGKRDVWAKDPTDALASTANYLSSFGWQYGQPAVVEAALPGGFDYLLTAEDVTKSAAEWAALGVTRRGGGALPPGDQITLLLPAGARGPVLATYPNFRVIKRYNNATSYALAVALLGERIAGRPGRITAPWPRDDRPLSRSEAIDLQTRLTGLGHDTKGTDGIIGPNTRNAVRGFQVAAGVLPDGYVSTALLARVRQAAGG